MGKFLVLPCVVLGVLVNPGLTRVRGLLGFVTNSMWACSVYMEAIAVAPQLVMMRNIAEKKGYMERNSTAHYVFALGIARFLGCASWILQPRVLSYVFGQTRSFKLWGAFSLISELVQTPILADFCYYYIKSVVLGVLVNPGLTRVRGLLGFVTNSMWACSVYMEAIAVAPQLVMMRNIAEKKGYMERNSTAHYVFALGIARFLGCAS